MWRTKAVSLPQFWVCDYLHDWTGISLVLATGVSQSRR